MAERIIKIAVIGAESTGKTWLCEALAAHYSTVWVPEYAREYFNNSDIYNYTLRDLEIITGRQKEMEQELIHKARAFLFCDTSFITLKIWAELEFESTPPIIEKEMRETSYDHFFITNNEISWMEDGLRQNKFGRDLILEMNLNEVKKLGIPFTIITGTRNERLLNALKITEKLFHK